MNVEIHQNCQFSQIMKFIFCIVLSSSIGIITMGLTKWGAETRKWNVSPGAVKMMSYPTGNDFAFSVNADVMWGDHWGGIIYLKAFLRIWAIWSSHI